MSPVLRTVADLRRFASQALPDQLTINGNIYVDQVRAAAPTCR